MSLIPVIKKTWIVIISEGVCRECKDSETGSQNKKNLIRQIKSKYKSKLFNSAILLTGSL